MKTITLYPRATQNGIVYQYNGLNGPEELAKTASAVTQISSTIAAIAASTGGGVVIAGIAGAVAGLAGLVGRIAGSAAATKTDLANTEAANAQLRLQILAVDTENKKLADLINSTNASIKNLNGICLFNCDAKNQLSTAQQQNVELQKELQSKLNFSSELASKALETVKELTGLKTEKNILLWGGGIALAASVSYLIYKYVKS